MDSSRSKAQWRIELLGKRLAGRRDIKSAQICGHLSDLCAALKPRLVASYHAMQGEPNLSTFNSFLNNTQQLLLPSIEGQALSWRFPGELVDGPHGTKSPTGARVDLHSLDLVLMPALAVDYMGYRLGRGGGYYDRSLAEAAGEHPLRTDRPLRVAVVYEAELLESLPHLPHDVRVHGAVTEAGIRWFV